MTIIKKKVWPEYFEAIASGKKKFELRLNDFELQEGDALLLEAVNYETPIENEFRSLFYIFWPEIRYNFYV